MTWHAPDDALTRYLGDGLDPASAASVEAHLLACDRCRERVAERVEQPELDAIWAEVIDTVDRPPLGLAERLLLALHVPAGPARLVSATPALRLAWLGAVVTVLVFGVVAAHRPNAGASADAVFLALAPLVPLIGIAIAYGPRGDPAREIGAATPFPPHRVLLLRSLAVLTTSILCGIVASLSLPGLELETAAWVLPALGATAAVLAVSTWLDPRAAVTVVATGWVGAVLVSMRRADAADVDRLAVFSPAGQVAAAAVLVVGIAVLGGRLRRLDAGVTPW